MQQPAQPELSRAIARWLIRTDVFTLLMGLALFLPAGTFAWWQGWAYLIAFNVIQILTMVWLLRVNPGLLVERTQVSAETKSWDQPLSRLVALVGPLAMCLVAGFDKGRGWSPQFSLAMEIGGLALVVFGGLLGAYAMASNPYFSSTVYIQSQRGHAVAAGGPYRWMRHPGYSGGLLYDLATPLALGSLYCFLPAGVTILFLILRTTLEDETLQAELSGYNSYAEKVPWRLIPGIW